ncbi:MAG: hypothetical protein ACKOFH_03630, partial [Chthoniobacterales bacterium]
DTPLPEPEQTSTQTPNERLWTAHDLARYIGGSDYCCARSHTFAASGSNRIKCRNLIVGNPA